MEQFDQDPSQLEQPEYETPEEETEPQAPVMVRIRLNGRTVEVTEDVADAIQAREADFQRQISKMGSELGQLRRQPQEAPRGHQEPSQDDDLEFFQSPTKAFQKREERLRQELRAELQQEYQREQAQQKWWGKFYSDHNDLGDHRDVIQFIVSRDMEDLKDLDQAACHQELARRARAFLGRPAQSGKPLPNRQVTTERSTNAPAARPQPQQPAPKRRYSGLSAELAELAEKRRRANYHLQKDE